MRNFLKIFPALILLFFIGCRNNNSDKASDSKSYQITKEELFNKEKKTPSLFLSISGHDKKNLLGQTVVKGNITNHGSIAVFKDVNIQLDFFSKTKALLETDKETIYERLAPGETKDFKTKYFAPKGTDSVALQVLSAKVVEEN